MPSTPRIDRCFERPVIPVIAKIPTKLDSLASASCVILQGFKTVELPEVIDLFGRAPLAGVRLLVHIDLIAGLENNEAGLEYLAQLSGIEGVVTVHQYLIKEAKRLGFLSVLRVFLSDSRALERGLRIITKSRPDVVDILPVAAAIKLAPEFRSQRVPYIAGGLCKSQSDVDEALSAGCRAVTCSDDRLWQMNN